MSSLEDGAHRPRTGPLVGSPAMVSSPTLSTAGSSVAKAVPMVGSLIGSDFIRGIVTFSDLDMGLIWAAKIKSLLPKIANYLFPNMELWITTNYYKNKQAMLCNELLLLQGRYKYGKAFVMVCNEVIHAVT